MIKKLNISLAGALMLAVLMFALPLIKGWQQAELRQERYRILQAFDAEKEKSSDTKEESAVLLSQQLPSVSVAHFFWPLPYPVFVQQFVALAFCEAPNVQALCTPATLSYYLTLMRCIISPQAP
jgi:hypothetical protein